MGIQERKEREKEQRRQSILNAAQHIFFEKGLENSTMDEIAREAELAKGTLYLYFKSKEDIQYEISLRGVEMLNNRMRSVIDRKKSGLENLLNIGWAFINFSEEESEFFRLFMFFQKIDIHKLAIPKEKVEDYFLHYSPFRLIIDLVERGITDGSLRPDLPVNDTATTLWSNIMGLLIVQQYKKEIYDIFNVDRTRILETNFDILMNGIKKQNS
ncbi:MAG: TetR/AcrR family transcriptional regulator [Bacteroidales bacterium]